MRSIDDNGQLGGAVVNVTGIGEFNVIIAAAVLVLSARTSADTASPSVARRSLLALYMNLLC